MAQQHPNSSNATGHVKLVQRKHGDQWYAKYRRPDGRQVERKLGPAWTGNGRPPAGYYTARTAEEALQAILTDLRRGVGGWDGTGATFADAATEYLRFVEHVRQVGAVTVKDYRGVINGYLLPEFGDQPIEAITPDTIDAQGEADHRRQALEQGDRPPPHRASRRVQARRRVWGLERNPASADLVERPKVVYTGEFDTLDRDELEALGRAAHDRQDAAIYLTAAYTGLRQGELLGLRWRDVDFVGGLVHVRRNFTGGVEKMPKGKRVRSVPMMPRVADELARLKDRGYLTDDGDLVFSNTAGDHLDVWALGAGSTRRSSGPGCAASASMICATCSVRSPSRCSTRTRSSRTWGTSTTRPHSATCTTSRAAGRAAATSGGRRPERLPECLPNRDRSGRTERT